MWRNAEKIARYVIQFHETEIIAIDEYKLIFCRHTFVVAFRALLKADRQISDSEVSGSAGETGVLTSARANLTGLVARPADAALIRKASWRTATNTCARKKKTPLALFLKRFYVEEGQTKGKNIDFIH